MTSFRQIDANCRNARKSTGPITDEGKRRSRSYAIPRLRTAIGALDEAKDYQAFEAADIAAPGTSFALFTCWA